MSSESYRFRDFRPLSLPVSSRHIQYSKRTHKETGACGFRCRSVLEESNEEMGINKKKTFSLRPEFVTVKVWNYHFCPSPMRRHRMNSSNTTVPLATHLSSHHDGVGRFSGADDKGPSLPAVNDECSSGGNFFLTSCYKLARR